MEREHGDCICKLRNQLSLQLAVSAAISRRDPAYSIASYPYMRLIYEAPNGKGECHRHLRLLRSVQLVSLLYDAVSKASA